MSGLPAACSHCGRAFSSDGRGARIAHLEFGRALCDWCVDLVEHRDSTDRLLTVEDRPAD